MHVAADITFYFAERSQFGNLLGSNLLGKNRVVLTPYHLDIRRQTELRLEQTESALKGRELRLFLELFNRYQAFVAR